MKAYLFDAGGDDRQLKVSEGCSEIADDQLLWIQVGLNESIDREKFGIPVFEEDMLNGHDPLIASKDYLIVRCPGFAHDKKTENDIQFFVGRNWFVSQTNIKQPIFERFIEADQGRGLRGNLTGIGLLISLLLTSFETYQSRISRIDANIDDLDETILKSKKRNQILEDLAALRARNAALRGGFVKNRAIVRAITRPDVSEVIDDRDAKHIAYLASVYDRVEDQIGAAREEVVASFELYATKVAHETNELIKLLTVVTVLTGIVGAIAGIMGMNVDVPLKDAGPRGFYIVLGIMGGCSFLILILAKIRRWF